MKLLISACLMGIPCRYDGQSKYNEEVKSLLDRHTCIPVCPEQLGGLPTPRPPAECRDGGVHTCEGVDVTQQYRKGAEAVLQIARQLGCQAAVLKERSPSCGKGEIHNGTCDGGLTSGNGITTNLLEANGLRVYGESEIEKLR